MPFFLLFLAGCGQFAPAIPTWVDQPTPSGPCYEANLLDGLDEDSNDELHAAFACINGTGALNAFAPVDRALDGSTRDGPVGHLVAVEVNSLAGTSFSVPTLLKSLRSAMAERDQWMWVLHLGMELMYGAPYGWLGKSVVLDAQASLDEGVVVPLSNTLGVASTAILDDDLHALAPLQTLLRSDRLPQVAWTGAAIGQSSDPTIRNLADHWAFDVADTLEKSANTANNRSGGDSLRDLLEVLLVANGQSGGTVLADLSEPLKPILADVTAEVAIRSWITTEGEAGRLSVLAPQLLYLATVDSEGKSLETGEASALYALVRLLHDANRDIHCKGQIIFEFDISLGNLAVTLLELLAKQDPSAVDGAVGLLGSVLGIPWLTDTILDQLPNVCSDITPQMVDDIHALDRLNDPQVSGLLYSLLYGLRALDGHIPDLANILTIAYDDAVLPPLEETLRDLADAALLSDIIRFLPVLVAPADYYDLSYFPAGVSPLDFEDVWEILTEVLTPDAVTGRTALEDLGPVLQAVLGEDGTWVAMGNLGALLAQSEAETPDLLSHLDQIVQASPDLAQAADVADLFDNTEQIIPLLELVESQELRDSLFTTEPTVPGPLPFVATLVVGGTLDVLLQTVDLLLTLLPEDG